MKKLMILIVALIASNAWASGEDLENCLTKDGVHMDMNICEILRKEKLEDVAYQKRQIEYREQLNLKQAEREAEKAKQQAVIEEGNKKRIAEMSRQEAENKRYREQMERDEAKAETAKKRKCGKDYNTLRIGMTLDNLEQCVGAVYMTKTVIKGGAVETYRTAFDWVHVQNGRVVSYTERTDN